VRSEKACERKLLQLFEVASSKLNKIDDDSDGGKLLEYICKDTLDLKKIQETL